MDTKKLIIICGSVIGGLVLLLLIVWLISIFKPTYITYEQLETKLIAASKRYVKDNESKFSLDTKYSVNYQTLVAGEYLKPIDEYLKDPANCSANVVITKSDGEYTYVPYLNCGTKYTTVELYKQILNDNPVTTSGSGLYRSYDGGYYFRGKGLKNFVAFGQEDKGNKVRDYLWQIISIDKNNNVKLKATFSSGDFKTAWDDRFNVDKDDYVGYNNFDESVIQELLTSLYENNFLFTTEEKSKLVPKKLCIGKRTIEDESKDGTTECSEYSKKDYYFGTIVPYEYMRISLDEDCKTLKDEACSNFNFLAFSYSSSEWSITASPTDNFTAYEFTGNKYDPIKTKLSRRLYVTIDLNEYSFFKSGDGSEANPYRLKLSSKPQEKEY